jgi:hypothetical protein
MTPVKNARKSRPAVEIAADSLNNCPAESEQDLKARLRFAAAFPPRCNGRSAMNRALFRGHFRPHTNANSSNETAATPYREAADHMTGPQQWTRMATYSLILSGDSFNHQHRGSASSSSFEEPTHEHTRRYTFHQA